MEQAVPKPNELLALHGITTELFSTLRRWFRVPDFVSINLQEVDSAVTEMSDPVLIAAMAMRKLQALHLLSTPGVRTTTDVVLTIVQDLDRALVQAPNMRLNLAAESTDWDAAFANLDPSSDLLGGAVQNADEDDYERDRFYLLRDQLHEAAMAVLEASEGEIRYFE